MFLIAAAVIAGISQPEYVTCHRQKMLEINGEKVCIYRGPNGTIGYHYPTLSFRECPKVYQCRYQSSKDKKPTINEILDGLKGGFE